MPDWLVWTLIFFGGYVIMGLIGAAIEKHDNETKN